LRIAVLASGCTFGLKTIASIPDEVFAKAERLARRSRTELEGEVWSADLSLPTASDPGFRRRPSINVQNVACEPLEDLSFKLRKHLGKRPIRKPLATTALLIPEHHLDVDAKFAVVDELTALAGVIPFAHDLKHTFAGCGVRGALSCQPSGVGFQRSSVIVCGRAAAVRGH